jgi:hypothetical protein
MRRIVIYQENTEPIILFDKDFSDFSNYILEFSEIMKYKEVITLEVSSGTVILKPSKISSISISEVKDEEFPIDIITDGE